MPKSSRRAPTSQRSRRSTCASNIVSHRHHSRLRSASASSSASQQRNPAGIITRLVARLHPRAVAESREAVGARRRASPRQIQSACADPDCSGSSRSSTPSSSWIDQRVITTNFNAEETLTSDTVPVNVDAVLFWMVYDPEKAALEVQDYARAVSWAAQTALRDIIGRTSLTDLLRGRERIEADLQKLIDERCTPWGVTVQSVEMRDVIIPAVAAGRDVARSPSLARKAGAHHPRPGRGGDRQPVPGSVEVVS